MKTPLLYFGLVFICLNLSCKSQQYSMDDLPEKQLVFGKGGGMSGAVDTYILLENGQLFHSNSITKETEELENIGKKEAENCFAKLDSLSIADMDFNHPGNMYYFLEEINGAEIRRITWGSENHEISEEYKEFYNQLRTSIK